MLPRYRALAQALDARFRIPGTPIRFGYDTLLGLIPGLGDALGALIGGYGLWVGYRLGAPAVVLARMLLNLAVDATIGSVPIAGDLFDLFFRTNLRNVHLLDRWIEAPHATRRGSVLLFASLWLTLVAACGLVVWLAVWVLRWLLGW